MIYVPSKSFRTLQDIPLKRTPGSGFISLSMVPNNQKKSCFLFVTDRRLIKIWGNKNCYYFCQLSVKHSLLQFLIVLRLFLTLCKCFSASVEILTFSTNTITSPAFSYFSIICSFHLKGIIRGLPSKHQLGPPLFQIRA